MTQEKVDVERALRQFVVQGIDTSISLHQEIFADEGFDIIATGGKPGEAQKRVNDAKAYLVNSRGMDANRIVTLTGRTGGDIRIEFWLVPPGAEAPTPQQ